ncbi:MAG: hypothetical protein ACI8X5_000861 [Planctomycetota bacterium]|jgi:hypothetical protein
MRITTLLAPVCALTAAALLCTSGSGVAYVFLGGSLDLGQRDFRVFNNFDDVEANDNTTPDPNFPGATGAVRAIWAATAEWGSELRRDGTGDQSQPFDLGSGGANFDSSYQGLAPDPGDTNDNTFSEITGQSFGVLAFTELPISDGWRIRFYRAPAVWDDGPGAPVDLIQGRDLQGVATHEFGHALGLDHSNSSLDNTMTSSASGNFYSKRSLAADDIAGVQALYGVRSASKPSITSYDLAGAQLTLHGINFGLGDNEVWFTRVSGVGDGTPIKVTGVNSSGGGTQLSLTLPAEAGSGDVLVRIPGSTGDKLSNAYPFDSILGECPLVETYGTGKLNSDGNSAEITAMGSSSLTYNNLQFDVPFGGIGGAPGLLFHGTVQAAIPFMGGTLYSSGPHVRDQRFVFGFFGDLHLQVPVTPNLVGQTRYYQLWYKDSGASFGVGLSNAVKVTFCP